MEGLRKALKEARSIVEERKRMFMKKKDEEALFSELCFAILAANYNAEKAWEIQRKVNFLALKEEEIEEELRKRGYRFPKTRARYIAHAKSHIPLIKKAVKEKDRGALLEIKGVGLKVASHFLRNCGVFDYAILDYHILDRMEKMKWCKKPRTLTAKKYLEIEKVFVERAKEVGLEPGILDLYIWYLETGKVVK